MLKKLQYTYIRWSFQLMIEFGGIRIADIFACTAMYISNAKSKLPIVRKWRATHAIVMAVVNWKYRCKSFVQVRARLSWIFSPFVDDQQRQRAKGISPFVSSRAMLPLYIHTYIESRVARGCERCGGGAKKGNNASMHWRAYASCVTRFFHSPTLLYTDMTYARIYAHTFIFPLYSHGERPSLRAQGCIPPIWPEGNILHHHGDTHVDIFVFWCMRNITTWEIYRDKMHRSFYTDFQGDISYSMYLCNSYVQK